MKFTNTDCVNFKVHGEKQTILQVTAMSKQRIEWGSTLRYPTAQYWAGTFASGLEGGCPTQSN